MRVFNLFQHGFQSILEFAAILCAGQHRSQVERDDALVLQYLGHVARNDALGKAFDDGGFADAGFPDQHGIIFRAARQHLHDAADFLVAANDRVELAAPRLLREIARVTFERLILAFRILVRDALRSANRS